MRPSADPFDVLRVSSHASIAELTAAFQRALREVYEAGGDPRSLGAPIRVVYEAYVDALRCVAARKRSDGEALTPQELDQLARAKAVARRLGDRRSDEPPDPCGAGSLTVTEVMPRPSRVTPRSRLRPRVVRASGSI